MVFPYEAGKCMNNLVQKLLCNCLWEQMHEQKLTMIFLLYRAWGQAPVLRILAPRPRLRPLFRELAVFRGHAGLSSGRSCIPHKSPSLGRVMQGSSPGGMVET